MLLDICEVLAALINEAARQVVLLDVLVALARGQSHLVPLV